MTGCTVSVDFGLLNGVGLNGSRTKKRTAGFDARYADWLMVHRGANQRDAKARAYTLAKVQMECAMDIASQEEAERAASITDNEFVQMMIAFGENHFRVLDQIRSSTMNSWELAERLGASISTIKRVYGDLTAFGLIHGSPRGVRLTDKGEVVVNRLLTENVKVSKGETMVPQDLNVLLDVKRDIDAALEGQAEIPLGQAAEAIKGRFDHRADWAHDYLARRCTNGDLPFIIESGVVRRRQYGTTLNDWR